MFGDTTSRDIRGKTDGFVRFSTRHRRFGRIPNTNGIPDIRGDGRSAGTVRNVWRYFLTNDERKRTYNVTKRRTFGFGTVRTYDANVYCFNH